MIFNVMAEFLEMCCTYNLDIAEQTSGEFTLFGPLEYFEV
jgi:hypothetical protein